MRAAWFMVGTVIGLSACAEKKVDDVKPADTVDAAAVKVDTLGSAEIKDADGKNYGFVYFAQAAGGVSVFGELQKFPPGEWGMHLHTIGACTDKEFKSAGGHWNPEGREHGTNNPKGHHFGDLMNMIATEDSVGHVQITTLGGKFTGDSTALVDADGGAVVIHLKPDDYMTDPTGNAGARVACGVIVKK